MKETAKIKNWQLLKHRSREERVDLSSAEFLTVGKHAFRGQKLLEEITLPGNGSAVKTEAFRGCRRLKKITLPNESNVGLAGGAF